MVAAMGDEQVVPEDSKEAGHGRYAVGTSVAAHAIAVLVLTVIATCVSGRPPNDPGLFLSLAALYFGWKARDGERRAMKWCLGLSIAFLVIGVLCVAMLASSRSPFARTYLIPWLVVVAWSLVNIVWLIRTLGATRVPPREAASPS
jgi:hypothetical protein